MEAQEVDSRAKQIYVAWASGRSSEVVGGGAGIAKTKAGEAASDLYELHCMETGSSDWAAATRRVKDWAYTIAAEFVSSRRGPAMFRGYRLDWGRQAARDGLAAALWGHVRGTGLAIRAIQFDIGERPYQRIRDHITDEAKRLLNAYETELSAAIGLDSLCDD
jgi:hypothetical protein